MSKDTKSSNVIKFRRKREEAKFTVSFIKNFKSSASRVHASNIPYLVIRTQRQATSKFYTVKKNAKLAKGAIEVPIGDIRTITLEEAKRIHSKNLALIASNVNPNKVDLGIQSEKETTIIEHVESRLRRVKKSGAMSSRTLVLNQGILKNHLPKLGKGTTFSSLTDKKLEDFYMSLSPAVARQAKSLLSSTFNKLPPKDKKDNENPADIIDRLELNLKQKTKKEVYLDFGGKRGSIGRFFEALCMSQEGFAPGHHYILPRLTNSRTPTDLLLFYLLTSVRNENIRVLKWSEVDWEDEEITFLEPKGKEGEDEPQILAMTPYLKAILKSRKDNDSEYVFPSVTNPDKPFDANTIDKFCTQLALFMCLYGNWGKKENNPMIPIAKKHKENILLSNNLWDVGYKETKKKGKSKLREELNKMGTKPHALRRTLSNIANRIGVSERTIADILNRSGNDVDSRHYISVQIEAQGEGLDKCHKAIDNRIAEYLSLPFTKKKGKQYFESPILALYGIKSLIEVDTAFEDCGHGFTNLNAPEKKYTYGDIDL
jgi:integrase